MYQVILKKEETYWWDEDNIGSCVFYADNDTQAIAFVATIVQSMNRKYWRINEPRNVYIDSICRVTRNGHFNIKYEPLSLRGCIKPLEGFRNVRSALEAFFFKNGTSGRGSMMYMFSEYKPIPRST